MCTTMMGAAVMTSAALSTDAQELNNVSTNGKKVIVLISDGNRGSDPYLESNQQINFIQDFGYPVYSWGVAFSEELMGGSWSIILIIFHK